MPNNRAAVCLKETMGYPGGENSKELQSEGCERYCATHGLEITARYRDGAGSRLDFQRMMYDATKGEPPFDTIVVWKLRNFS